MLLFSKCHDYRCNHQGSECTGTGFRELDNSSHSIMHLFIVGSAFICYDLIPESSGRLLLGSRFPSALSSKLRSIIQRRLLIEASRDFLLAKRGRKHGVSVYFTEILSDRQLIGFSDSKTTLDSCSTEIFSKGFKHPAPNVFCSACIGITLNANG